MELCTARAAANLPRFGPFTPSHSRFHQFHSNVLGPKFCGLDFKLSGLRDYINLSLKSSLSDESSTGFITNAKDGRDGVVTFENTEPVEKEDYGERIPNEAPKDDFSEENLGQFFEFLDKLDFKKVFNDAPKDDSLQENVGQLFQFLEKLDFKKIDSGDAYSFLLLGGSAFVAVYLASAVVGAIDSIPVIPKLMQVIGLSYTIWFTTRYLVFKKSREELAARLKEIKQEVLGSD